MGNGRQLGGPINGGNPLVYTGNTPNMVTYNRRPTVQDGFSWPIGMWWIVPIDDNFEEGEVWTLISKAQNINTWKKLENTVPPDVKTALYHLQTVSTNNVAVPYLALSGSYFSQYDGFLINLNNVSPDATGSMQLNMYMSTDNGSTFIGLSGGGLALFNSNGTFTYITSSGTGGQPVIGNLNSVLTGGGSGQIYLSFGDNLPPQDRLPRFSGTGMGSLSTETSFGTFGGLYLNNAEQVNYIKFVWENSSRNILDGIISIYAYVRT
jgi:hypothetical protein